MMQPSHVGSGFWLQLPIAINQHYKFKDSTYISVTCNDATVPTSSFRNAEAGSKPITWQVSICILELMPEATDEVCRCAFGSLQPSKSAMNSTGSTVVVPM